MEWGISYNEFMQTPADVIELLREYLRAKSEGQQREEAARKREEILNR